MSPFLKTCVTDIALLVALAVPVFAGGCERQSEPPVTPRSAWSATGTGPAQTGGGAAQGQSIPEAPGGHDEP